MLAQIKLMARLEFCNLFGINVLRFTEDKRKKKRAVMLSVLWVLLIIMLLFYVGGLSWGLVEIGAGEDVPAYVIAISSMLIFVFGILKAGSIIFRKQGYDMVVSLPVRKGAVVLGRFLRMYTENLLVAALVLLPGIAVYAWKARPDVSFYLCAFLGIWSVPLLPMTGAVLIGALVTGISSRMRQKPAADGKGGSGRKDPDESDPDSAFLSCVGGFPDSCIKAGITGRLLDDGDSGGDPAVCLCIRDCC